MAIRKNRKKAIAALNKEILAERALSKGKQKQKFIFYPRAIPVEIPDHTFSIGARMIDGRTTFLARVIVRMTTVPEVPEVVTLEGNIFHLIGTTPLTYEIATSSEATRV